jgi:hypothetical protein
MQQMHCYPVEGHCCSRRPAEVNYRRADPRIRVERFIGKTNRVTGSAGEPSDKDMDRAYFITFLYDCKLFFLGIIS